MYSLPKVPDDGVQCSACGGYGRNCLRRTTEEQRRRLSCPWCGHATCTKCAGRGWLTVEQIERALKGQVCTACDGTGVLGADFVAKELGTDTIICLHCDGTGRL